MDEFQDCDRVEHELLAALYRSGMGVVTVADPDQAIYEFRQSATDLYERYREKLESHEVVQLDLLPLFASHLLASDQPAQRR